MTKSMDRKPHEPGWGEVILGAALSVGLGVVLGGLALVFKPVETVRELPKEPVPGQVYFVEGSRDSSKAKQIAAKRKAFASAASGTLSVSEDELNTLATPSAPAPAAAPKPAKPGEKAAPAAVEAPAVGTPNFRIRSGVVQIGFPMTFGLLGLESRLIVQAQGNFVKRDGVFVFEPDTLTVGSCPVQRLPFASTYVKKKFLAAQTVAEDVAAAWPKLTAVAVEANMLKLTMP